MSAELEARLEKYLAKARLRFEGLELEEGCAVDLARAKIEYFEMAQSYYSDALHFHASGDHVSALAALEYAEGWLDAGRSLGIFRKK